MDARFSVRHRVSTRTFLKHIAGALFGYDFFIAYARRDGRQYAVALKQLLAQKRFECFLDSESYIAGDDWKEIGAWSLTRTSYLVFIASPFGLESDAVVREVGLFKRTGRRVFAIDFEGSLSVDGASSRAASLLGEDTLTLRDTCERLASGDVSPDVIAQLDAAFVRARQETKRLRWVSATAIVLAALAAAAVFFAARSRLALRDVRRAAVRAEVGRLASEAQRVMPLLPQSAALLAIDAARFASDRKEPLPPSAWSALYATLNNLSGEPLAHDVEMFGLSADSQWILGLTKPGALHLWRLTHDATPVCSAVTLPSTESIEVATFSPDGRWLLVGGRNGTVAKASLAPADLCPRFEPILRLKDAVGDVEVSPDGNWLLVYSIGEWTLAPWPIEQSRIVKWKGDLGGPHFDPLSRRVFTTEPTRMLCARDLTEPISKACTRRLTIPDGFGWRATFDPTGRRLAIEGAWQISVWDLDAVHGEEPDCKLTINQASTLAFSSTGRVLYGGDHAAEAHSETSTIRAWDFAQDAKCPTPTSLGVVVKSLIGVVPFGDTGILGATEDGKLITWDAVQQRSSIRAPHGVMGDVAIARKRGFVAASGSPRHIELWPLQNDVLRNPRKELNGFDTEGSNLKLTPDERWLVASSQGELRAWAFDHSPTGQPETVDLGYGKTAAQFDQECTDVGICVIGTTMNIDSLLYWNLLGERGPSVRTIPFAGRGYHDLSLSPSGRWLVARRLDGYTVDLIDLDAPTHPRTLFRTRGLDMAGIGFSPDETLISVNDPSVHDPNGESIRLWTTSGSPVEMKPPRGAIRLQSIEFGSQKDLLFLVWFGESGMDLLQVRIGDKTILEEPVPLATKTWVRDHYLLIEADDEAVTADSTEARRSVWIRPIRETAGSWSVGKKVLVRADATVAAISSDGSAVALIDRADKRTLVLHPQARIPTAVAVPMPDHYEADKFSPDGRWLVALGPSNGRWRTYGQSVAVFHSDGTSWTLEQTVANAEPARKVAISSDGRWLATGADSGLVRLYELPSLVPIEVFRHEGEVRRMFFDRSSRFLFSQAEDQLLHRADVVQDALIQRLKRRVGREIEAFDTP